jgi:uncharacterized protein YcfL
MKPLTPFLLALLLISCDSSEIQTLDDPKVQTSTPNSQTKITSDEAYNVCSGLEDRDECEIKNSDNELQKGQCKLFPGDEAVSCQLPSTDRTQTPPGNTTSTQPSPPTEAINACQNASNGDNCSFQAPDRMINGTCFTTPENILACKP